MTCPTCNQAINEPAPAVAPPHSHRALRVDSQIACACGATLQISTVEGWERWYVIASGIGAVSGTWRPGPDAQAFVERLTDSQFTA